MLGKNVSTLMQAARGRVVARYYGQLCTTLIGLTAVPLAVALALGAWDYAWRLALASAALVALGLPLGRLYTKAQDVQVNEALSVTVLVFATATAALVLPLMAGGLSFLDALFEATSAITTTGLSVAGPAGERDAVFLFIRAWGQWYGGLVIVVVALALVLQPGAVAKRLSQMEGDEELLGGTRNRARRVLGVYALLTVVGTLAVWAAGPGLFDALLHVLAAVSTGGFSSLSGGLAALGGWPVQALVTLLSLCGAVSFSLYFRAWRSGPRTLLADREFVAMLCACVLASLLLGTTMAASGAWSWPQVLLNAPLNAFSAQTTTGFATLELAAFDPASKLALIFSMFIGGDMGSTAGGIKILRLLAVLYLVHQVVVRTALPRHAIVPSRVAGRRMDDEELRTALTVVLWYLLVVLASWLPFLLAGIGPLDALFEVVSAVGTVGLSSGVTGPALHPALKVVLVGDMLLGRLEVVAVLVLIYPPTWLGRRITLS